MVTIGVDRFVPEVVRDILVAETAVVVVGVSLVVVAVIVG